MTMIDKLTRTAGRPGAALLLMLACAVAARAQAAADGGRENMGLLDMLHPADAGPDADYNPNAYTDARRGARGRGARAVGRADDAHLQG
jgi:hypothetical protein